MVSYMQSQICSGFEDLEKNESSKKFISTNLSKEKKIEEEELIKYQNGKFLIKLESNKSTVSGTFSKNLEEYSRYEKMEDIGQVYQWLRI